MIYILYILSENDGGTMTRQSEIAYMQARVARIATEKWELPSEQ